MGVWWRRASRHPVLDRLTGGDADRVVHAARRQVVWVRLFVGLASLAAGWFVWPGLATILLDAAGLNLDKNFARYALVANVVVSWGGLIGWILAGGYVGAHIVTGTWMTRRLRPTPCPGCLYTLAGRGTVRCPECGEQVTLMPEPGSPPAP
ncbi:MAG: hypothetical protein U0637_02130 [Phycisphaerales bacterium]